MRDGTPEKGHVSRWRHFGVSGLQSVINFVEIPLIAGVLISNLPSTDVNNGHADRIARSATEEVFDSLVEGVWSFQVRDVPHIWQFHESRAWDRLSSFFRELGNVPKISAQIDRRPIFPQGGVIFLSNNEQRRNLYFGEFIANGLLINHQSR
jgi:hypothetical protein